jgi:hypothetical protein
MFWELYQSFEINRAKQTAEEAEARIRRVDDRTQFIDRDFCRLEGRVDALAIGCQAMWELLRERTELTDDDILQRIHEIDLRDGEQDGRISANVVHCTACDRPVKADRKTCLYCGDVMSREREVFDR